MKWSKSLLALLGLLLVLSACQREDVLQDDSGLTSPSGVRLADDYESLGSMIEGFMKSEYNVKMTAQVTDIYWMDANGRELAFVTYADQSGAVSKFAVTRDLGSTQRDGDLGVDPQPVTVSCKDVSCSTHNCALGVRTENGWTIYQCGCNLGGGNSFGPGCEVQYGVGVSN